MGPHEHLRGVIWRLLIERGALAYQDAAWVHKATGIPLMRLARDERASYAHVAIICPGRTGFQGALKNALEAALLAAGMTFQVMVHAEGREYQWEEHTRLCQELMRHLRKYDAWIIIVPMLDMLPPHCADEVFAFASGLDVPVVFPDLSRPRRRKLGANLSFVTTDDRLIGELGAGLVARYSRSVAVERLLVVTDGSKEERVAAFKRAVALWLPECRVMLSDDGGVTPADRTEAAHQALETAFKCGKPPEIVWCKSDGHALAVHETAPELYAKYGVPPPAVVSSDGGEKVRWMLDAGQITDSVMQDAGALAEAVVKELTLRLCKEPAMRSCLITPSIWRGGDRPTPGGPNGLASNADRLPRNEEVWGALLLAAELMRSGSDPVREGKALDYVADLLGPRRALPLSLTRLLDDTAP